ncbi:MAG: histidine kinase [Bacteroidota bacterium]
MGFFLPLHSLWSQPINYINYNTYDGLPSSEVYDIELTDDGRLWFTTDRGVCLYDGYEFRTYTTDDGLLNNTNFEIFRDQKGHLWFNSYDARLSYYADGTFHEFPLNDSLVYHMKGEYIESISTNGEGQYIFWMAKTFENFNYGNLSVCSYWWMDTNTGQCEKRYIRFEDLDIKTTTAIPNTAIMRAALLNMPGFRLQRSTKAIQADGSFLYFYKNQLYRYKEGTVAPIGPTIADRIDFLYQIEEENLWVCTDNGLFQLSLEGEGKIIRHFFPNLKVTSIVKDKEDNFWISTIQEGIFKVKTFDIEHISIYQSTLEKTNILSLIGWDGLLFFSSEENRLYSMDEDRQVEEMHYDKEAYNHQGFTLVKDTLFTSSGLKITRSPRGIRSAPSLQYGTVRVFPLENGQYISINATRLRVVSGSRKNKSLRKIKYIEFNQRISDLLEFPKDTLLFGTINGLYKSPKNNIGDPVPFRQETEAFNVRYTQLAHWRDQGVWAATLGKGLYYIDQQNLRPFTLDDGLASNLINSIYVENDSTLWLGTNKGVDKITLGIDSLGLPFIRHLQAISISEGLSTNYINAISKWDDKIWLATDHGLDGFSPELIVQNQHPPSVLLEKVLINNINYANQTKADFAHDQNDLSFHYTGICFAKPQNSPFYRYRMLNSQRDTSWEYTNGRDVSFNNLVSGSYRFELMARNKNGIWSDQPIQYDFFIRPHFSETWWFRSTVLLLLAGSIWLLYKRRIRRIQIDETYKRNLQRAELETLRGQMNPHFVFNSLNSIQNFIFKKDIRQANHYLSKFSRLMRDSLQFSRLKYVSLDKEVQFIRSYLELEKMRFPERFDFEIHLPEETQKNQYFVPPLLIQPLLENAIKHAFKDIEYKGLLRIEFEEIKQFYLQITVTDNGIGIDQSEIDQYDSGDDHQSLGLKIIHDRIKLINRGESHGRASFQLENLADQHPAQQGTRAIIQLPIKLANA